MVVIGCERVFHLGKDDVLCLHVEISVDFPLTAVARAY